MSDESFRDWTFRVRATTHPGEVVCITGSCSELGSWSVSNLVALDVETELPDGVPLEKKAQGWIENIWSSKVRLPVDKRIHFRFIVVTFVSQHHGEDDVTDPDNDDSIPIIRRWESSVEPRVIQPHETCDADQLLRFGQTTPDSPPQTNGGWITKETVILFKIFGKKELEIWDKKFKNARLFIKVSVVSTSQAESSSSTESGGKKGKRQKQPWSIVEVAKLTEDDCYVRPQEEFGIEYANDDDFILFRAQMLEVPTVAFLVDVYGYLPDNGHYPGEGQGEHIGRGYIMPSHFTSTVGKIQITIISKAHHPVGQLSTHFCVIRPMPHDDAADFSISHANHWGPHPKCLDVGHRGLGNSFTKKESCATVRENTIGSMKDAAAHGADMVEFDVQLSRDLIPVVYHDFELLASVVNRNETFQSFVQMPVKSFTLKQLQHFKIHHPSEESAGPKTFQQEMEEDRQPFPTLEAVLTNIDTSLGFNVELKWSAENLDPAKASSEKAFELNLFVDTILKCVLQNAGKRRIIFSSFDPDICHAIRLKQNRYPVLFLTQGVNSKYKPYLDPRTRSIATAAYFCTMAELLGVNAIAEDVLRDPDQVRLVKDKFKLIFFCWTDDHNDKPTIKKLKSLGLDGVIYDRMDHHSKEHEGQHGLFVINGDNKSSMVDTINNAAAASASASVNLGSNGSSPANSSGASEDQQPHDQEEDGHSPPAAPPNIWTQLKECSTA